jgi:hypothetical protein
MLPEEHRVLQDYAWLEERVGPLVPLEVVVNVPAPEVNDEGKFSGYPMLERMRLIRRLEQSLAEIEGVDAVVSAATFAPNLHPKRERVIWRVRVNRELSKHRSDYVESGVLRESPTGDLWRISARVKASRKHDYVLLHEQLKKQINGAIADREDQTLAVNDVMITGSIPVVQKSQEQVLKDLFSSYATALLLIAIAMTALLRSIPAGLVSMIPNAFPAIVIFGMLGWFGVKIEVGSMMTATVAMGIAVDDTLHFLTWFRRGLLAGLSRDDAVKSAYDRCGVAMIQTTLICGLGLLVFVVSPFGPISRFSWLMFAMLSTALVGDLIVLPAILLSPLGALFTPRVKKDEHREHREKECEEEEEAVREAPRPHMAQRRSITA